MPGDVSNAICARIDELADELIGVSRVIHAKPELAFEEHFACRTLVDALCDHGLEANAGVFTLATAFSTEIVGTTPGPTVAILAEYDALPDIGHACGHNIIASAALGATLALNAIADILPGRVRLLGTPAEERGGGKELMARAGAFDGVDAAMMIHPAGVNLAAMPTVCVAEVEAIYHGSAAHAAAAPHKGVNALDGLLLAYQAISNLRQHIRASERIHGIITEGGSAPNIVPDRPAGRFLVRAADERSLAALKPRVEACFQGGAKGSGCRVEVNWTEIDYLDLNTNWPLANCFQGMAESLGREFFPFEEAVKHGFGSTDMGNVSYRIPSIHPMLAVSPPDVAIHSPAFEKWAGSEHGDSAVLDGAKALALTAAEFLNSPNLQAEVAQTFDLTKCLT